MRARRFGIILFMAIAFMLGWSFRAAIAAQSEEKESYSKEMRQKLQDLDRKIEELQGKAVEVKEDAKMAFDNEMTDLRRKQKGAKRVWKEMQRTAADKWDKVKADMEAAVRGVEGAYDKAASRFKEHKE